MSKYYFDIECAAFESIQRQGPCVCGKKAGAILDWLSTFSVLRESWAVPGITQYLFIEVAIDSANCSRDALWDIQQQIVFTTLQAHRELGLSGAGRHCGCSGPPPQPVCEKVINKAVVKLLYESSNGIVNANQAKLDSLKTQLGSASIPLNVVKKNESSYYVCANLEVITESHAEYKNCVNFKENDGTSSSFTNPNSDSDASGAQSGKPGTATIVGAAVGALAGLGLLSALAWLIYRHIKKGNQVDDSGSSSDISPIIPGFVGIGEAPNSTPPAGTN